MNTWLASIRIKLPCVLAAVVLITSAAASANTVAHYRFEEGTAGEAATGAIDSSGNGYDLVSLAGGNPVYSDEVAMTHIPILDVDNNLSTDFSVGNVGFVSVDDEGLSEVELDDFTIEAWLNFGRVGGGWQTMVGRDDRGNQNNDNNPLLRFQVNGDGNFGFRATTRGAGGGTLERELTTGFQPPVGEWVHLAVVADLEAQTLIAYADGQQIGQLNNFTGMWHPTGIKPRWTIGMGQWTANQGEWTEGLIDEVRISSAALAPTEFLNFEPGTFEITSHPASLVLWEGDVATFSTTVFSGAAYSVQWEISEDLGATWSDIAGATEDSYSAGVVDQSMDRNRYRAVVTRLDNDMTLTTDAAILRVGHGEVPEPQGVVAHYRFEGASAGAPVTSGIDSSGNGHHLQNIIGSPVYSSSVPAARLSQTGEANNFSLDVGGGDYGVTGVDGDSLSQIEWEDFTIEAWVNFGRVGGGWQTMVGRDDRDNQNNDNNPLLRFQVNGGGFFGFRATTRGEGDATLERELTTGYQPPVNEWVHLAVVADLEAQTLIAYANGQQVGQLNNFTGMWHPTGVKPRWTIGMGQWTANQGEWTEGLIDEVRLSDRALSTNEFLNFNPSVLLFTTQPQDVVAHVTDTITFTAVAAGAGTGAPDYQWQVSTDGGANWTDLEGVVGTEYTIESATLDQDGNQYRVIATRSDPDHEEISRVATLTIDGYPLPQIVQAPPELLLAFVGDHIVLTVEATGQGNLTYQWFIDGEEQAGETGTSLDLGTVDLDSEAIYSVVVSDDAAQADQLPPTTVTLQTELILIPRPAGAISLNFVGAAQNDFQTWSGELGIVHPWEEAGFIAVTHWNNSPSVPSQSTPFPLVDDLGESTTATATWASGNTWGPWNSGPPLAEKDAHQRMFHGYIESRGGSSVTISNVPYTTYDVYVYPRGIEGGAGEYIRSVTLTAGGTETTFYGRNYSGNPPLPSIPFVLASATTQAEANQGLPVTVFRFTNVSGSSFTVDHQDVVGWNLGGIAGISIVDRSAGSVPRPVLTSRPMSQFRPAGGNASFSVAATSPNGGSLSYQWQRNGVNIPGATSATLNLSDVDSADSGIYTVVVTDSAGSTNEANASLSVAGSGRSILVSGDLNHIDGSRHDHMSGHAILRQDGTVVEIDPGQAASNPHEIGEGDTVWNRLSEFARGIRAYDNLVDHEGFQLPGLTLSINAPGASAQDAPTGGGIDDPVTSWSGPLLRDSIVTAGDATMSFTVSGLNQFAGLEGKLVVYSHGPQSTHWGGERNDVATVTLDAANSPSGEAQSGVTDPVEGRDLRYNNFAHVAFDVVVAANGTVSWTIGEAPGFTGMNAFNGFQLLLTAEGELIPPGEGIADWRMTYFGTSDNAGLAANDADFDGDGLLNLIEYALGSNPTVAGDGAGAVSIGQAGGYLTLTFSHIDDPSLLFVIESSDDLNGGWSVEETFSFVTVGTVTFTDTQPIGAGPRFLRLRVEINE